VQLLPGCQRSHSSLGNQGSAVDDLFALASSLVIISRHLPARVEVAGVGIRHTAFVKASPSFVGGHFPTRADCPSTARMAPDG
jgi:hypothetical protein